MILSKYFQQSISTCSRFKQLFGQGANKHKQLFGDVFTVLFGESYRSCVCSSISRKSACVANFLHILTEIERKDFLVKRVVRVEARNISSGGVNDTFKANSRKNTSRPRRNGRDSLSLNEKFSCVFGHSLWRLVANAKRKHHSAAFPKVNLPAFRTYGQRVFKVLEKLKEVGCFNVSRIQRFAVTDRSFDSSFFNGFRYGENF